MVSRLGGNFERKPEEMAQGLSPEARALVAKSLEGIEGSGVVERLAETATLEEREVLAHRVQLVDRRPGAEQALRGALLVAEGDAPRRRRQDTGKRCRFRDVDAGERFVEINLRRCRDAVRALHEAAGMEFIEIFVDCSLEEAEARDPKGLYKKARAGEIPEFTGISAPYEEPLNAEVALDTNGQSVDESVAQLIAYLDKNGYLG